MSFVQYLEEVDFSNSYNRADKFAGFDRGDLGRDDDAAGRTVIGRMTNGAGQRVVIVEEFSGFDTFHAVEVDGARVFFEEDNRERAVIVARWWMSGCPA